MELKDIRIWAESLTAAEARRVHIQLTRLVMDQASPALLNLFGVAERAAEGRAELSEVLEARAEVWALLTSMTCGAGPADSALMHLVLTCLGPASGATLTSQIADQAQRALSAGADESSVSACLRRAGLQ